MPEEASATHNAPDPVLTFIQRLAQLRSLTVCPRHSSWVAGANAEEAWGLLGSSVRGSVCSQSSRGTLGASFGGGGVGKSPLLTGHRSDREDTVSWNPVLPTPTPLYTDCCGHFQGLGTSVRLGLPSSRSVSYRKDGCEETCKYQSLGIPCAAEGGSCIEA